MTYRNPVIPGFHPDPSICRVGEDYYLATSTFEYCPGVPIFHSRDLVHWRRIGHCLTRRSQLDLSKAWSSGGVFAPTLRHHDGRFYMITTNVSGGGHLFVTATDPAGEWSEPTRVAGPEFDPDLFWDDDGTVYYQRHGRDGIYQCRLDLGTGKHLSEEKLIWTGSGAKGPEGPHLYKIRGRYYLMIAEGGTEYGHLETIARSDRPDGPFEPCPRNPILTHRSIESPIQVTGHADLVEDHRGNWWAVFLGVRPVGYPHCHHLGRETFLAPVRWDADGWPVIGNNGTVALEMDGPTLPPHPWPAEPTRDDFDATTLGLEWNYLRNPDPADYSLTDRPGWLRLRGSKVSLFDMASPAWVGRRQTDFDCRAETLLDFAPRREGDEAGLVVRMNERHHYEVYVTFADDNRRVRVRRTIGQLSAVVADEPIDATGPVRLIIRAVKTEYRFAFAAGDRTDQELAIGETRYLSTEVAGGFTGVYLAMYATGNGSAAAVPADFDYFDYEPSSASDLK